MTRLGAVLAGGRSERFGSDKALALWRGRPLIAHAAGILARHANAVVVCGRRTAPLDLPCLPDQPRPGLGPLGGLCAALRYAAANGHEQVLTLGCDMPLLDEGLIAALTTPGAGRFLAQAPVVGCWPAALAEPLLRYLETDGDRAVRHWAAAAGVESLDAGAPLANLNTPDDLAALGGG